MVCGDEDVRLVLPEERQPEMPYEGSAVQGIASTAAPYRTIGQGADIPSRFLFYHADHLGSPRLILDKDGNVEAKHHYLPFGDEYESVPDQTLSTRGFTGHEEDPESGLTYMLARYYSSSLGRFVSPDSRGITSRALVNPQKLNKYAYVLNNPISNVDPDGMEELSITFRTYIPQQQVTVLGHTYAGDGRGPSTASSAPSRTTITVRMETDASIRPGNPIISVTSSAGQSRELNEYGCTTARATATTGLPTATGTRDVNGNAVINIQQDTKNPLSPAPQILTPGISASLTVTVPQNASSAEVTGTAAQFPAQELNVTRADGNTTPVMQYTPDPGASPWSLIGHRNVDAQASTPK
jgi:RHS repeat-associated protein